MKPSRGRRWWLGAFAVFLGLLGIWVLAVFQLIPANAHPRALGFGLLSHLQADYGADPLRPPLAALRLSIVGEALADLGLPVGQAQERQQDVEAAMLLAVPTATPRDFDGSTPHTATPVPTSLPTDAPLPSSEPVLTATETPQSTQTPTGTETASSQAATATPGPSPTQCYVDPVIQILMPTDSPTYGIADSIPVQAFAYDPDNVNPGGCQLTGVYPADDGAGIDRVEFEIWLGGSKVYSHSDSSAAYCGFGGSASCSTFRVSSSTWPGGQPVRAGLHTLRARSRDGGNHWSGWATVYFTLDIPSPTATSTRTPTRTPTATRTRTPTRTAPATWTQPPAPTAIVSATATATPTPTSTATPSATTAAPTTETPTPTPLGTDTPSPTLLATDTPSPTLPATEIPSPTPT
jgi:hypothetical protein